MQFRQVLLSLALLCCAASLFGQSYSTISDGDIEAPGTWSNGVVPPFNSISPDTLEVPAGITVLINHLVSSTRDEVINRGHVISIAEEHYLNWRNYSDFTLANSWNYRNYYFINEASGYMLFGNSGPSCHHFGCGSENFGQIYIHLCTSNMCAIDSTSGLVNHPGGEIHICNLDFQTGFCRLENNWTAVPWNNLGSLYLKNYGLIEAQTDNPPAIAYGAGNYVGNALVVNPQMACVMSLPVGTTGQEEFGITLLITVYPNPSRGTVNIETDAIYDQVQLYDVRGKLIVEAGNDPQLVLDLEDGFYIMNFLRDGQIIKSKNVSFFSH